ncbi:MAG: hypothetical protein IT519_12150 [Burkholderiales bacterium]|nr:hypothetical protein [Burkholderiales bacterium]
MGVRVVVAVLVGAAIVAAIAWQRLYSQEAQIERAYEACMTRFGGGKEGAKAATPPESGSQASGADALGKAMQDLVRGVTAGMSEAVCGALRDACRADFDGVVCRNAIAGFR